MLYVEGDTTIWMFHLYGTLLFILLFGFLHYLVLEVLNSLVFKETPRNKVNLYYYLFILFGALSYVMTGVFLGVGILLDTEEANRIIIYMLLSNGLAQVSVASIVFSLTHLPFSLYHILKRLKRTQEEVKGTFVPIGEDQDATENPLYKEVDALTQKFTGTHEIPQEETKA
jgi:hypothetical protein